MSKRCAHVCLCKGLVQPIGERVVVPFPCPKRNFRTCRLVKRKSINPECPGQKRSLEIVRNVSGASKLENPHRPSHAKKPARDIFRLSKLFTKSCKVTSSLVLRTFLPHGELKKTAANTVKNLKEKMGASPVKVEEKIRVSSTKPFLSIPGPKGLPFLGSALDYTVIGKFSPKEYHKALRHRHNRYGKIFRERILNEEFIYISDPNDIRLIVQNEGSSPCRPHLDAIVTSRLQEGLPIGITAMQGEEWLRNRNAINPAIAIPRVVKKYRFAQREIAKDLVTYIKTMRNQQNGEVKDFDQVLNRWALESIAVAVLDTRLGLLSPANSTKGSAAEKLHECMDIFFDYGARLTFGMPIWKLWNTKDWKIFRESQRNEFKYAGYFVEEKLMKLDDEQTEKKSPTKEKTECPFRERRKSGKGHTGSFTCLLDHVINNSELNKEEAVTVCLELVAGGIDTTATASVFTLYHLAVNETHQEYLRKLLVEEEEEFPDPPEKYDKDKSAFSKYLKACVWESMRLNPLTYANVRTTEKDLVLSGYAVPAGTSVRYTSHLMNLQNDEFFPQAKKFIPERWLDRSSPYRCEEQFTFTPFGHGARQCPGRRVAEQELDLLFREIIKNFHIDYKYGKMGNKVRLFNKADKAAAFGFTPLK